MALGTTRANRLVQTLCLCILGEEEEKDGNIRVRILEFFDVFIRLTLSIDKEMMPGSFKWKGRTISKRQKKKRKV